MAGDQCGGNEFDYFWRLAEAIGSGGAIKQFPCSFDSKVLVWSTQVCGQAFRRTYRAWGLRWMKDRDLSRMQRRNDDGRQNKEKEYSSGSHWWPIAATV